MPTEASWGRSLPREHARLWDSALGILFDFVHDQIVLSYLWVQRGTILGAFS